ncbi:VOC family protein [Aquimarina sp. TRL1]|uniref:VOC family protein n=1 Tax=Aquimarina sp. (strain TRL1) TaxID=2736252 RepID=UPI00158856E3|nr:VOC family protein [Aquimarina sp. TRL1]QKX03470.1 VOC family protein [Aquimarina sp. TRL1]
MKSINPVCWFDIHVADLERAKKFYETVFTISLVDLPLEWGKQATFPFDNNGVNATGALVEKEAHVANNNNTVVYFSSEDCITEETRVENAGGKIIQSKTSIGEFGFISLIQDTEGNTIGLHSKM